MANHLKQPAALTWCKVLVLIASVMTVIGSAHADCENTELNKNMKDMKTAFKAMNGAVKMEDWPEIASSRLKMEKLVTAAYDHEPLKLADVPADKQVQFLQQYKRGLDKMENKLADLAMLEKSKDIAAAKTLVEAMADFSKESHRSFKKKCD